MVQIGWLVTYRYNILEKKNVQFYMILIYSKGRTNMKNKVHQQNKISFWFHVSIPNFVWIGPLSKNLKMFDIFCSTFLWRQNASRVDSYMRPNFSLISITPSLPNLMLLSAMYMLGSFSTIILLTTCSV